MDVHLRRLRAFVVLAEELHFTRAAARLFVAQQALSKQIAELEGDLGTPLLERTSRKVGLTPAGEIFLAAARETLARFDQGVNDARRTGEGWLSTLRVGFIAGAALELTPHIFNEFAQHHPHAPVELHEYGLADPSAGLRDGSTDVAFIRLPSDTSDLGVLPLFSEPCVVGIGTSHRLSRLENVKVADLLAERVAIGRTDDPAWRSFWTLGDRREGKSAPQLVETNSQSEEMEVVAAGMACTITPAAARRYTPHPGVRFIPIDDYERSSVAIAHRPHPTNPLITAFVDAALGVRDREAQIVAFISDPLADSADDAVTHPG